jgi:hypothetical protein
MILDRFRKVIERNRVRTVTVFSFPHATKEQLDALTTSIQKVGKTSEDIIFSNTDLRDGSTVNLKVKGDKNDNKL